MHMKKKILAFSLLSVVLLLAFPTHAADASSQKPLRSASITEEEVAWLSEMEALKNEDIPTLPLIREIYPTWNEVAEKSFEELIKCEGLEKHQDGKKYYVTDSFSITVDASNGIAPSAVIHGYYPTTDFFGELWQIKDERIVTLQGKTCHVSDAYAFNLPYHSTLCYVTDQGTFFKVSDMTASGLAVYEAEEFQTYAKGFARYLAYTGNDTLHTSFIRYAEHIYGTEKDAPADPIAGEAPTENENPYIPILITVCIAAPVLAATILFFLFRSKILPRKESK